MFGKLGLSLIIGVPAYSHSIFAQVLQGRIAQPIIVNGQQAQGAFVIQNGTIQSQTCPSPRTAARSTMFHFGESTQRSDSFVLFITTDEILANDSRGRPWAGSAVPDIRGRHL